MILIQIKALIVIKKIKIVMNKYKIIKQTLKKSLKIKKINKKMINKFKKTIICQI